MYLVLNFTGLQFTHPSGRDAEFSPLFHFLFSRFLSRLSPDYLGIAFFALFFEPLRIHLEHFGYTVPFLVHDLNPINLLRIRI